MKNLQIDIKIKIQINDATLELSKEQAELLYNTLGTALNKHAHPFFQPYTTPWTTTPYTTTPWTTIDGNNQLLYPPGVRSMTPTSTIT
jgi:hypothetical protein